MEKSSESLTKKVSELEGINSLLRGDVKRLKDRAVEEATTRSVAVWEVEEARTKVAKLESYVKLLESVAQERISQEITTDAEIVVLKGKAVDLKSSLRNGQETGKRILSEKENAEAEVARLGRYWKSVCNSLKSNIRDLVEDRDIANRQTLSALEGSSKHQAAKEEVEDKVVELETRNRWLFAKHTEYDGIKLEFDVNIERADKRILELEVGLGVESDRRKKATNKRDRANELCDRVQAQMCDLNESLAWKPIPKGSPEIEDVRFLLGRPDDCGDKMGIQAAGYWDEDLKWWVWPFGRKSPPTHYKELTKVM